MISRPLLRRLLTAGVCAAVIAVGGLTTAAPASAAANICSGDICVGGSTTSDSVSWHVWAYYATFTGYFRIQAPDGKVWRSPTTTWPAGGTHFTLTTNIQQGTWQFNAQHVVMGVNIGSIGYVARTEL